MNFDSCTSFQSSSLPAILKPVSLPGSLTDLKWQHAMISGPRGEQWTKILLRPDGKLQIWPCQGHAPFPEIAASTLQAALALRDHYAAAATFVFRSLTSDLEAELRVRATGLGVNCYQWVSTWAGK